MKLKSCLLAGIAALLIAGPAAADTTLSLVEVITSPERTETLKQIVKTFEDANPGTHVEITSLPWSQAFEKFATMVSAGDTPDVVEMPDRWQALYANNGMLENLEPYLAKWDHTSELNDRTLQMARYVGNTAYALPYGFYLRAMFINKTLFKAAGIDQAPKTMDEFTADAKKISAMSGKYGYCLRGGPGGLNGWVMFGAGMNGDNSFFTKDGTSTFADPGWVKGMSWLVDLYKNGYAPKDAVNWGFNEIVAGF
ncbi:MAG TPA: extracellular solute-binding protein, partial [Dongiaceae bacterium]